MNEPGEGDNILDVGLKNAGAFYKQAGWQAEFFYTGSFPKPNLAEDSHLPKSMSFSQKNFRNKLIDLKKNILSGNVVTGDQILLVIDAHGRIRSGQYLISTVDGWMSIDKELTDLVKASESRNVKLAIVNLSCYSGQIQKLGSEKTCVISTSRPDNVSFSNDGEKILGELKSHENLEEAYLTARAGESALSQPLISTSEGRRTSEALQPLKDYFQYKLMLDKNYGLNKTRPDQLEELKNQIGKESALLLKPHLEKYDDLYLKLQKEKKGTPSYNETAIAIQREGDEISKIERRLYTDLYRNFSSKEVAAPNPCRDFKLKK